MSKIEINDLNEEITISEEEIKHVNGGTSFLKIPDIDGESLRTSNFSNYVETDSKGHGIYWPSKWKI